MAPTLASTGLPQTAAATVTSQAPAEGLWRSLKRLFNLLSWFAISNGVRWAVLHMRLLSVHDTRNDFTTTFKAHPNHIPNTQHAMATTYGHVHAPTQPYMNTMYKNDCANSNRKLTKMKRLHTTTATTPKHQHHQPHQQHQPTPTTPTSGAGTQAQSHRP